MIEVMISLPGGRSSSSTARYSAEVPEFVITPYFLSNIAATRLSISRTRGPTCSSGSVRSASTTAAISSSP